MNEFQEVVVPKKVQVLSRIAAALTGHEQVVTRAEFKAGKVNPAFFGSAVDQSPNYTTDPAPKKRWVEIFDPRFKAALESHLVSRWALRLGIDPNGHMEVTRNPEAHNQVLVWTPPNNTGKRTSYKLEQNLPQNLLKHISSSYIPN
ncbi:MAG: hypothetical protein UV61_C0013G0001 [Candidatus Gottesmanbacteria bacterium GW2011_GWB1_43_11]|uniref:Uncharacterized protein n=1 Tax=Candidatus Gottesmanbacteria bacterium GW2011_GWB1_43_11 TaxID=1618446 RepID=A0A0G1ESL6_9BACT|nr:MAG: hypothetical protein UV17_C0029G0001 [Candidatus Gottesmanbacteria bacterium GW2011_GWA1_42_26]KKS80545.1 MAG: hypothetical protein UV55_C0036G0014 [Candidatus Gottesmanbacteria bacterium GW2011_GWC1_43_10]KKS86066.1 MAG: hypothetical protein UV61_C0013G0001 [Candidatus Gottesmanbacteria bacterium GW2011_GWB1_43_11]